MMPSDPNWTRANYLHLLTSEVASRKTVLFTVAGNLQREPAAADSLFTRYYSRYSGASTRQ
jgi:hypothetical protein